MPATAAASSFSEASPVTPTAPRSTPSAVAYEDTAGHREDPTPGQRGDRGEELRRVGGAGGDRPVRHPQPEHARRLGHREVGPQEPGPVLPPEGDQRAAGVQHRDRERVEPFGGAVFQRGVHDRLGLLQRDAHRLRPSGSGRSTGMTRSVFSSYSAKPGRAAAARDQISSRSAPSTSVDRDGEAVGAHLDVDRRVGLEVVVPVRVGRGAALRRDDRHPVALREDRRAASRARCRTGHRCGG